LLRGSVSFPLYRHDMDNGVGCGFCLGIDGAKAKRQKNSRKKTDCEDFHISI